MYFQILLITKQSLTNIYVLPVASDLAKSFPSITLFNPPNDTHGREIINPHLTGEKRTREGRLYI